MQSVILNNGVEMPILGFEVNQIEDENECEQSVYSAISAGYRLIDTAAAYLNEEGIGRAIKRSNVPREELFVTAKLWIQDADYEDTKRAFEKSLKRLRLDYLDLYLMHQPFGDVCGSWRAMEELYREGKIRAIGGCNFQKDRLVELIVRNEIIPAVNQVETNPFSQQIESTKLMKENNIQIQSGVPFPWKQDNLFKNDVLILMAEKYNKSVAQLVSRWLTQRGVVAIQKSLNNESIIENLNIFDFELSQEDMERIAKLDTKQSCFFKITPPNSETA